VTHAHRWLYAPVDTALVSRGTWGEGALDGPTTADSSGQVPHRLATLGKGDGALVLLRFAIALPPEAEVLEAYLLLRQEGDVDADPDPIVLHAARVTDPWDGRRVTWAHAPRVVEMNAPVTRVGAATARNVRLDVRAIVQRWRRRPGEDFGIAVVAEGRSATGVTFALEPVPTMAGLGDPVLAAFGPALDPRASWLTAEPDPHAAAVIDGPELELYVK
jgi:hypothetical protein